MRVVRKIVKGGGARRGGELEVRCKKGSVKARLSRTAPARIKKEAVQG